MTQPKKVPPPEGTHGAADGARVPWTGVPLTDESRDGATASTPSDAASRSPLPPTNGGPADDESADDGSDLTLPPAAAGVPSEIRPSLAGSAASARIPFIPNPAVATPSDVRRPPAGMAPVTAPGRPTKRGRGVPANAPIPTTSRTRPESRSQEELVAQPLPTRRRWRRQRVQVIRSTSSRRMVRRVDTWTVFKVSLFFYLLGLLILLVAGVILWNVATTFGTITSIEKSIKSLFDLTTFQIRPRALLEYTAAGGLVLVLLGTIMNTVAALLYNLISDIAGGVQIVVVTEPD